MKALFYLEYGKFTLMDKPIIFDSRDGIIKIAITP